MVFKYVSTALLVLASVSPLNGLFPCIKGICKKQDIKKFVCTRDRIWTYNTSSTDFIMCKFDHMKTYRNMTMFFTRSFFVDDQWRRNIQHLEGHFSKQHNEVMQVSNKDQQEYYDLRVWDTYLKTRPHEKCIKRFEKLTQRGRGIYMPKCKIILRIK
uniref:Putative group i salivary lipocalin n=1 Tax=Rhipicephalus pulchellus TaxID=72859 RepID=L7LQG9_RHIPC